MTARATVTVDLAKVEANARDVVDSLGHVDVVGVTKVTCGSPEVARAMLAGGCRALGDSRLENVARLRHAGIDAPMWLLRSPVPGLADEVVRLADVSLQSEPTTLEAISAVAARLGRTHRIVVMVDLGDLREGVMPAELPAFLDRAEGLAGVEIVGLGTSLTCYGGVVPDSENLGLFVRLVEDAERRLGRKLVASGGMSSTLHAAAAGELPERIDNLRIGESILLGVSTVTREPVPGLYTDAITVEAPIIECARKPTAPLGTLAQDAFGHVPVFEDRGERLRAILAIGRQDVVPERLRPLDPGVEIVGASSDHLIVDVEAMPNPPTVGGTLRFVPGYAATLALFTSPYVEKVYTVD